MEISTDAATTLAAVRDARAAEWSATAETLGLAAHWADLHPVDDPALAAVAAVGGDVLPLAGVGVPLVAASCVPELAAAVGVSTESGQLLIGDALELRHRLPRLWALTHAGRVPTWRARQVARATRALTPEGAAFVDRQVAAVAGRVGPVQLERLITATVLEFMPDQAEQRRRELAEQRRVDIRTAGDGTGLGFVDATLDLVDALDLDHVLSQGARSLADAGCAESRDVRRAMALGELARRQPALDLVSTAVVSATADAALAADDASTAEPIAGQVAGAALPSVRHPGAPDPCSGSTRRPAPAGPRLTLYLHLSADALTRPAGHGPDAAQVGWVGNTRTPVTAGQIRDWCGRPGATVTVRPVIDLNQEVEVDGYVIPNRLREHVALRNPECVFPYCHRPAHPTPTRATGSSVDLDHTIAWDSGGTTSTANLTPLCRRHHNAKTHHRWRYLALEPGRYLWTSPHGLRFLRDRHGTTDLTPDRSPRAAGRASPRSPQRAPRPAETAGQRPPPNSRSGAMPTRRLGPTRRTTPSKIRTRAPATTGTGDDEPPPF